MKRTLAAVIALLALATVAFAHGGGNHVKGTVTAVTENAITIQTPDKETKTVTFDASTKFQKSGKAATAQELKAGDRVVIDVEEKDGKLSGTLVRFGATKRQSAKAEEHKH